MAKARIKIIIDTDSYVIVAAIDFGTTHSGFAFSTKSKPNDIIMNKNWGSEYSHESYKCPTSVLTDPQGKFVSFGYMAENDYSVKLEEGRENYQLYRHFKMSLDQKNITRKSTVVSTSGKKRAAMDIFEMAIRYLKEEILKLLRQQQIQSIDESLIRWVITVPAIWKDQAKRFMREAGFKAGIITDQESKQLLIALEPEAASMHCRHMELKLYHKGQEDDKEVHFKTGERYLIIDAGGGTVDITCHEVQSNDKVREIHPATGGAWGSIYIDQNFEEVLHKIFGKDFIRGYKKEYPNDWFDFMLKFEHAKAAFKLHGKHGVNLQISWSLGNHYQEKFNEDIDGAIKEKRDLGVDFDNGALVLKHDTMVKLMKPVITKTLNHVKDLFKKLQNIKYILLVGGFGQSELLQEEIKREFGNKRSILVPTEGQLAIIKGAVAFGHNPTSISTRVSKLTYGFGVMRNFDEKIHKPEYQTMSFGKKKCDNIFDLAIRNGEDVETESVIKFDLTASEACIKAGYSSVSIYSTPKTEVLYTTEDGVQKLATLKVEHSDQKEYVAIAVHFVVGGTELLVEAQNKETKEWVHTTVDFLSDEK